MAGIIADSQDCIADSQEYDLVGAQLLPDDDSQVHIDKQEQSQDMVNQTNSQHFVEAVSSGVDQQVTVEEPKASSVKRPIPLPLDYPTKFRGVMNMKCFSLAEALTLNFFHYQIKLLSSAVVYFRIFSVI